MDFADIKLYQPPPTSHKGQNGKLLVIGGSKLFHSSIFWAADVASRVVDIVHLTSPANENNQIFRKRLKEKFWNGIVVDWGEVEKYIEEDDAILIGPGMIRNEPSSVIPARFAEASARRANAGIYTDNLYRFRLIGRNDNESGMTMKTAAKYDSTSFIVNFLLRKYPDKRWVIDGGALQEVDPRLITESCILTPHRREFEQLIKKLDKASIGGGSEASIDNRQSAAAAKPVSANGSDRRDHLTIPASQPQPANDSDTGFATATTSHYLHNATILLKGPTDTVCQGDRCVEISGGNPGMTKGGTGDVLAGLVAALYCKNNCWTAATVGSWVNKKAGDNLYAKTGPYFNTGDLVEEVPPALFLLNNRQM